jgi:hypothetical protein
MIAMSFMTQAYCKPGSGGRASAGKSTHCHDLPRFAGATPESAPGRRPFRGAQWPQGRQGPHEVNAMSAHAEVRKLPPRLFNWLAVIVLLSLGVLL